MIFADFKDFVAKLPAKGRLLGIDWGARRVGLAVSDESREFIFPRKVIMDADNLVKVIIDNANFEKVVGIIIGLPQHADGTDSETTHAVRLFADILAKTVDIPITFIDERLTSAEAKERKDKKTAIDTAAAAIILEDAISMIKRIGV
ncbi:MAG: Holliday junction resolvase RuvX [Alphaproteobacteria bacterium]|nr:Holliday junction resolvase RuvX [Alphaproteobacteria bacterium]